MLHHDEATYGTMILGQAFLRFRPMDVLSSYSGMLQITPMWWNSEPGTCTCTVDILRRTRLKEYDRNCDLVSNSAAHMRVIENISESVNWGLNESYEVNLSQHEQPSASALQLCWGESLFDGMHWPANYDFFLSPYCSHTMHIQCLRGTFRSRFDGFTSHIHGTHLPQESCKDAAPCSLSALHHMSILMRSIIWDL